MNDFARLIEHAFPLKQASLDSVHEKNVRHGHISTLHIWPARRPLAACRAALIATLLPDPGTSEKRRELCAKIAGRAVKKIEKKKMPNGSVVEGEKWETEGGILHRGRTTHASAGARTTWSRLSSRTWPRCGGFFDQDRGRGCTVLAAVEDRAPLASDPSATVVVDGKGARLVVIRRESLLSTPLLETFKTLNAKPRS